MAANSSGREKRRVISRFRYYARLSSLQDAQNPFPNSDAEENSVAQDIADENILGKMYEAELKPYNDLAHPIDESKCDMKNQVGHKVHLNVAPEDVLEVSGYLISHGYCHKYLSGGEILDGKVFTVYFGSKDLAVRLSQELSTDLEPFLKRPITAEEVEYAPNVVGRFVGSMKDFMQYGLGLRGISVARNWADHLSPWQDPEEKKKVLPLAFTDSFNKLADEYGEYFYGTR